MLGWKRGIPSLATARMQQWALILSAYNYQIEFKPTQHHANMDVLSRLPCKVQNIQVDVSNYTIGQIQA